MRLRISFSSFLALLITDHVLSFSMQTIEQLSAPTSSRKNTPTTATTTHHTLSFPLMRPYSTDSDEILTSAFEELVNSTDFFVPIDRHCCSVPLMGAHVSFRAQQQQQQQQQGSQKKKSSTKLLPPREFVLTVQNATAQDFAWICAKFQECQDMFQGLVSFKQLEHFLLLQQTESSSSPGVDASKARLAGSDRIRQLFDDRRILQDLQTQGYVVIDENNDNNIPKVTATSRNKLYEKLKDSAQDDDIRTDRVAYLSRQDACECELELQYDILMGIASYLNDNLQFDEQQFPHLSVLLPPATKDKPLTNPVFIQAASYGFQNFYVPHRDNDIIVTNGNNNNNQRSNFRHYTAILYCNDDWSAQDGGALRLYPGSANECDDIKQVVQTSDYVDVIPQNARLLLFDSRLVHSVEKVLQREKPRLALTLWIKRPVNQT